MTEVPKIVYDRLRAARLDRISPDPPLPLRSHPDADLLTAFAEQTLSSAEREGVLEHLALCGDCREVITLALPAADMAAAPIATENGADRPTETPAKGTVRTSWLRIGWPNLSGQGLRWAALAAGVVVAASLLLLHPARLNQAMLPSANRQSAMTAPPSSVAEIASSSAPSSSPIASSPMELKTGEAQLKSDLQFPNKVGAMPIATPHPAASGMLLADNKTGNKKASAQSANLAPGPPATALAFDASTRQGTTSTEVAAAAPPITADSSAETTLMARNDAPAIEKAKPAPQATQTQTSNLQGSNLNEQQQADTAASPGPARLQGRNVMSAAKMAPAASQSLVEDNTAIHNTNWKIRGGVLQRSLNSGQSWQDTLRSNRPLLCYATRKEDVWAGGQAGTLFHSVDGGVTWLQVRPSINTEQLSSDLIHIELQSNDNDLQSHDLRNNAPVPTEIIISTSSNELWSSADGGKTWAKK